MQRTTGLTVLWRSRRGKAKNCERTAARRGKDGANTTLYFAQASHHRLRVAIGALARLAST